jgi:hypothetical protein
MLLVDGARAHIRNSSFRDFELEQEIFDVSFGSSVRLENCTFTNITVPENDYVSTSYNDWEFREGISYDNIYYPEDDEGPLFDVLRHRANDSSIPEEGAMLPSHGRGARFFATVRPSTTDLYLIAMKEQGACRSRHEDRRSADNERLPLSIW